MGSCKKGNIFWFGKTRKIREMRSTTSLMRNKFHSKFPRSQSLKLSAVYSVRDFISSFILETPFCIVWIESKDNKLILKIDQHAYSCSQIELHACCMPIHAGISRTDHLDWISCIKNELLMRAMLCNEKGTFYLCLQVMNFLIQSYFWSSRVRVVHTTTTFLSTFRVDSCETEQKLFMPDSSTRMTTRGGSGDLISAMSLILHTFDCVWVK